MTQKKTLSKWSGLDANVKASVQSGLFQSKECEQVCPLNVTSDIPSSSYRNDKALYLFIEETKQYRIFLSATDSYIVCLQDLTHIQLEGDNSVVSYGIIIWSSEGEKLLTQKFLTENLSNKPENCPSIFSYSKEINVTRGYIIFIHQVSLVISAQRYPGNT